MKHTSAAYKLVTIFLLFTCQPSLGGDDPTFKDLMKRVKSRDTTVNFTDLRMAFTHSDKYKPYYHIFDSSWDRMYQAIHEKKYRRAIRAAKKIFKKNEIDIQAHYACYLAYEGKGDEKKSAYHHFVANGLLLSISKSGDGQSIEDAFQVISIKEEYAFLEWLGLRLVSQSLTGDMEHTMYDHLTVEDIESGDTLVLIFDISSILTINSKTDK